MKKEHRLIIVVTALLTSFSLFGLNPHTVDAKTVDEPWVKVAFPDVGESYTYTLVYNTNNILLDQPEFPTTTGADAYTLLGDMEIASTNTYISEVESARVDYFTMGSSGFIYGSSNLGRISKITLDIDETKYTNIQTELAGALGIQLKEGRVEEWMNAEDNDSGPTYGSYTTGIFEWDLTVRDREHPFFLDESRLDDISNVRIITINPIHFESITIEGTRFLEITNGTTLYPVFVQNEFANFTDRLFDINLNNMTNLGQHVISNYFNIIGFDNTVARPLENMEVFTIQCAQSYDGIHYLKITNMEAIILPESTPILTIVPANSTHLIGKMDGTGWKSSAASITYGGQDALGIDESIFGTDDNFYPLGFTNDYGHKYITLFNAETMIPMYTTNQGMSIVTPIPGVTGDVILGSLAGMIMDEYGVTVTDVFLPDNPPYGKFVFDQVGDWMRMSEAYRSQGSVQSMEMTVTVLNTPEGVQPSDYLDLQFTLIGDYADPIIETERTIRLSNATNQYVISYDNLSGYYGTGVKVACTGYNNFNPEIRIDVDGFEYYENVTSAEQQAMYFMWSFMYHTDYMAGTTPGDGICEFANVVNDWDMLETEFGYMATASKTVLENNINTMQSSEVNTMFERYEYIQKSDVSFTDFMTPVTQQSVVDDYTNPTHFDSRQSSLQLTFLALITVGGYLGLKKRKFIR